MEARLKIRLSCPNRAATRCSAQCSACACVLPVPCSSRHTLYCRCYQTSCMSNKHAWGWLRFVGQSRTVCRQAVCSAVCSLLLWFRQRYSTVCLGKTPLLCQMRKTSPEDRDQHQSPFISQHHPFAKTRSAACFVFNTPSYHHAAWISPCACGLPHMPAPWCLTPRPVHMETQKHP